MESRTHWAKPNVRSGLERMSKTVSVWNGKCEGDIYIMWTYRDTFDNQYLYGKDLDLLFEANNRATLPVVSKLQ